MPIDPAGLHIVVHADLPAAEPHWRAAQSRLAGTAFQDYDWVAAWHATLGRRQGWTPCVAEVRQDGREGPLRMLLPLGWRRERGLRVLGFLGGEMIDYQAPLVDAGFARALTPASAQHLWRRLLAALPPVDLVRFRRMPQSLPGELPHPLCQLPRARHTENAHAASLPADFAAFAAARDAKLFADTRRQLRRLSELGTVRVAPDITDAAERLAVLDALAEQKSRRWRATGSRDVFAEPGYRAFLDQAATQSFQGARSVISALYLDERPIATHWGLRTADRFYWLMPAYAADLGRFSPGRVLMEAVIRRCIEEGLPLFDLTVGDEAYKAQWADRHLPLYALEEACSMPGWLALGLARLRQKARGVPALRAAVRALRQRG